VKKKEKEEEKLYQRVLEEKLKVEENRRKK
jgi:hypothetical protein